MLHEDQMRSVFVIFQIHSILSVFTRESWRDGIGRWTGRSMSSLLCVAGDGRRWAAVEGEVSVGGTPTTPGRHGFWLIDWLIDWLIICFMHLSLKVWLKKVYLTEHTWDPLDFDVSRLQVKNVIECDWLSNIDLFLVCNNNQYSETSQMRSSKTSQLWRRPSVKPAIMRDLPPPD